MKIIDYIKQVVEKTKSENEVIDYNVFLSDWDTLWHLEEEGCKLTEQDTEDPNFKRTFVDDVKYRRWHGGQAHNIEIRFAVKDGRFKHGVRGIAHKINYSDADEGRQWEHTIVQILPKNEGDRFRFTLDSTEQNGAK